MNDYAWLLSYKGDYAGAEDYMQRAITIAEESCGSNDSCAQGIRKHLEEIKRMRPGERQT